jgi:DNA-directed RNA polymerase specialized sigma24 family protein
MVGEPLNVGALTADERQAIVLLSRRPQSLHELAENMGLNLEQTQSILQRLNRKVGLVALIRDNTLRYALAE